NFATAKRYSPVRQGRQPGGSGGQTPFAGLEDAVRKVRIGRSAALPTNQSNGASQPGGVRRSQNSRGSPGALRGPCTGCGAKAGFSPSGRRQPSVPFPCEHLPAQIATLIKHGPWWRVTNGGPSGRLCLCTGPAIRKSRRVASARQILAPAVGIAFNRTVVESGAGGHRH